MFGLVGCGGKLQSFGYGSTSSLNSSPNDADAVDTPASPSAPTPAPTPAPAPAPSALAAEVAHPTFTTFPSSYFKLTSGQKISVDGVSLQITAAGDIQVVNGTGGVLWSAGSKADCAAACSLYLQNDGNLVMSANGKAVWGAGTYATATQGAGGMVTLSSVAPYFTVTDGQFNVIWPTAGVAHPPAMLVASRVGSAPASARSFLDSLAVNSHVDQNGISGANMMTMLNYLGVKTIRDGWKPELANQYIDMAKQGVRFSFGVGDPYANGALTSAQTLNTAVPGSVIAVEGPNEINNWSFVVDGVTSNHGWPNDAGPLMKKFMTKLFSLVHADALLKGVQVYNLTWGGTTDADQYGILDLDGQADLGNIHPYPKGQPYRAIQAAIAGSYHHVLPSQAVITETGYATGTAGDDVSERAQAILNLNIYLGTFQQGFVRTYIYELYDEWQTYGLFKGDFTPKPTATAIHNLTTILADDRAPTALGSLNYKLSGLPATAHSLLLQKSNGAFELVLWNEAPVYANGADLQVNASAVTVELGQTVQGGSVYDPIQGATALSQFGAVSRLTVNLGADALVIEVRP